MDPLKMYFLLKMGIFNCHVSLPEGTLITKRWRIFMGDEFLYVSNSLQVRQMLIPFPDS